jgi:xanthine dehydrogenase accessory factor
MHKQLIIWQLINKSLQQHIPVMLLYVLQSDGSSPGRAGFCMAINAAGEVEGSIGGGIMEHKFLEMAKERLSHQGTNHQLQHEAADVILKKQYHNKTAPASQSGMICSGEQTILLYDVLPADAPAVEQLINSLQQNNNGTLQLSPAGLQFSNALPLTDFDFTMRSETDWLYREKTGYKHHVYIIGAGHCALALSRLMKALDFYVHLYDDRSNLKTFEENDAAHEKQVISDYKQLGGLIPSGNNHYIVVMTVGYRTDDIVVRTLWNKQFRYFGLLGSKSKIEKLFADYRAEGIPAAVLLPLRAPVGIAIHSQTPEEIAVSIAAEIIQVKNGQQ